MVTAARTRKLDRLNWAGKAKAPRRPGHSPLPRVADGLAVAAGLGFGACIAVSVSAETSGALHAPGGLLLAAGRVFGFAGAYLLLCMLVLIARVPWFERTVGQDRLVRWHRKLGPWPLVLISLHVVLVTLGYAARVKVGPLHQFWSFVTTYPDMWMALVGFVALLAAGLTSAKIARNRVRYETWWTVHVLTYLAMFFAFWHQIATGVMFIGHPLTKMVWTVAWIAVAALLLGSRVVAPLWHNYRHQLRVAAVQVEAPGVISVTIEGRDLARLAVSGGQFFQWRFLSKGLWLHSHPFSLSALPRPPYLRITVKAAGDHSRELAHLRPGTRVLVEGPYGAFTKHAASSDVVTLIGAGVGVTPLRALLEDLPRFAKVTVIVRASSEEDLVHREEIIHLVEQRNGTLYEIVGPRHKVRFDARVLDEIAPDMPDGDVYICGPEGFTDSVVTSVERLGVLPEHIHHEAFAF